MRSLLRLPSKNQMPVSDNVDSIQIKKRSRADIDVNSKQVRNESNTNSYQTAMDIQNDDYISELPVNLMWAQKTKELRQIASITSLDSLIESSLQANSLCIFSA
eukprot:TRINITY_DN504_c0_g3_i1.p2 TRINITY_DN504_c0_g3~~TRINITY_DN504_c0_g3_i1.p2  ORF type:complete len:104 (-),score=11.81 TRINITY_DN504_c0_g3_i1:442-753(-)